jgi:hypothetical protein
LSKITHRITYEDFSAEVEIAFMKFENYACRKSQNVDVLTLCGNILNLESSGFIYKLGCFAVFVSIFLSIANLGVILMQKKFFLANLISSHYITAGMYWTFICTYFILSSSESMVTPSDQLVIVNFENGAFLMFLAGGLSLATLAHFFYMKKFMDFEGLLEKCQENFGYSVNLQKTVEEPEHFELLRRENKALQDELKLKEREIGELNQKINDYAARIEALHENESIESQSSHHIVNIKKRALRAGKKGGVDTIESLKQENGNLRAIYSKEKHE